jgi:hypothetical protein
MYSNPTSTFLWQSVTLGYHICKKIMTQRK